MRTSRRDDEYGGSEPKRGASDCFLQAKLGHDGRGSFFCLSFPVVLSLWKAWDLVFLNNANSEHGHGTCHNSGATLRLYVRMYQPN